MRKGATKIFENVKLLATKLLVLFISYKDERPFDKEAIEQTKPYIISEYYDFMEKAALDIMEHQKPIDKTIILWWGLNGLRLNEDGTIEQINRKKRNSVLENVFYQPCQSIQPIQTKNMLSDQTQCTSTQMDALMEKNRMFQMQAAQYLQNKQIIDVLQLCCVGRSCNS